MIGTQPTGALDGVVVSAVAHEGLTVAVHGKPGRLAIIDDQGRVIAAGADVAAEVEAVAVNSYRALLRGQGHLRVMGAARPEASPEPAAAQVLPPSACPAPKPPTRTALYRYFDADGRLLYVGISTSWVRRAEDHARGSHWTEHAASAKAEWFPSREEALQAERDAIKRERPLHNIAHAKP